MKPRPQTPLVRVMNSAISNLENSREGKNDRMKEYEKERLKNLNNQHHSYNYRNYVKK